MKRFHPCSLLILLVELFTILSTKSFKIVNASSNKNSFFSPLHQSQLLLNHHQQQQHHRNHQRRPLSTFNIDTNTDNADITNHRHHLDNILNIIPRGGSLMIDKENEEEDESSVVVLKLRNIIRSLLEIGEKNSPISTKVFKVMVKCFEKMTGLKLLPPKKQKKSKSRKTKGKENGKNIESNKSKAAKENSEDGDTKRKQQDKSKPNGRNNAAAQTHLKKNLKMSNPNYRIQRELKEFISSPPPNLSVKVGKNIRVWIITMKGTKGSLYENEKYRLRVTFPSDYPTSPPSVFFLQPTPRHEHVYTNGDICLSLLGKDWRPTMTAQSIANSILSILSGASRKSLPMDNVAHAKNKPGGKQDDWIYHDDNC
mmetsp:Transcript_27459/g.33980  ORF Transcript_27459/g.33980 Transcript_27459/m.33980 type:complete len:369 (-) Transcript_27459:58-1164(-)